MGRIIKDGATMRHPHLGIVTVQLFEDKNCVVRVWEPKKNQSVIARVQTRTLTKPSKDTTKPLALWFEERRVENELKNAERLKILSA